MQTAPAGPPWVQFLPLAIVAIVLVIRLARPQRISVTRMWVSPIILVVLCAAAIYFGETLHPAPPWEIAVALIAGAVAGAPLGILRGIHTDVRPTDRPGVMYLGSSWITGAIFIVAFGIRYAVRAFAAGQGQVSTALGDGVLAFAIAFIVLSYVVIYRKYQAELAGRLASAPAPPEMQTQKE
ncbi:MAG TPA: hypothetical protein VJP76_08705 [Candidatus Tumulicola sp.]|nr:hypothetical protein [Candidatus Tumulicola sp.]